MRKLSRFLRGLLLIAAMISVGCGEEESDLPHVEPDVPIDEDTRPDIRATLGEISWGEGPCTAQMECAKVDVPLDWFDEGSRRISLLLRLRRTSVERKGQVWLLPGGPGQAAEDLLLSSVATSFLRTGYDVFAADYRGTGGSTLLACSPSAAHTISTVCLLRLEEEWGDGLRHFSTTASAIDTGMLIDTLKVPDEKVFVWGGSYGTLVANRYLTFFPDQVDGAILDSLCPPEGCRSIPYRDRYMNEMVKTVMDACGRDAFCSSKLTAEPWSFVSRLMLKVKEGHCKAVLPAGNAHLLASALLVRLLEDPHLMELGFAAAYRLDRCDAGDIAPLRTIAELYVPEIPLAAEPFAPVSRYLYAHVLMSEFWPDGLTADVLLEESAGLAIVGGAAERMASIEASWTLPTHRPEANLLRWARTEMPVLLLNGTLEHATPAWDLEGIEAAFDAPHQHFIVVPFKGHITMMDLMTDEDRCITGIMSSFLDDPRRALDTSCVQARSFPDVRGTRWLADWAFGTPDPWGDTGARALQAAASEEAPPGAIEALERARKAAIARGGF